MNEELTLIKSVQKEDEIGDIIDVYEETYVLCEVESVTRSEFYYAAKADMRPEIIFVINKYDYDGQSLVEFKDKTYDVIRSYEPSPKRNPEPMDIDRLELVCKGAV